MHAKDDVLQLALLEQVPLARVERVELHLLLALRGEGKQLDAKLVAVCHFAFGYVVFVRDIVLNYLGAPMFKR